MNWNIRPARQEDLAYLSALMNQAYRSNAGQSWTNEAAIVEGARISYEQLVDNVRHPNFELWVLENHVHQPQQIYGCIGLTLNADKVEIGSFCVDPFQQNMGLGRALLNFAEQHVRKNYSAVQRLEMYVLSVRAELIAFYERCGYVQTEHIEAYPLEVNVGIPVVDLHLVHLQKQLS